MIMEGRGTGNRIAALFERARRAFLDDYRRRERLLAERGIFGYMRGARGYVLVIVLLVTAMLVSISAEFLITAQTNINYVRKFSDRNKAHSIARTGIELCKFILEADKRGMATGLLLQRADKNIDCFQDLWALEFPDIPLENGAVKIRISDENAKINLSVLANEFTDRTPYYVITQRFFMNLGLPMDLADSIIDWVDIDDARFPYGAESSDYYMSLEEPYRARNGELDSLDELLLVRGMSRELFWGTPRSKALADHVTVHGSDGRINVNTAPLALLKSLHADVDAALVARLEAYRRDPRHRPLLADPAWYKNIGGWPDHIVLYEDLLTTRSAFFQVSALARHGAFEKSAAVVTEMVGRSEMRILWRKVE